MSERRWGTTATGERWSTIERARDAQARVRTSFIGVRERLPFPLLLGLGVIAGLALIASLGLLAAAP